MEGREAVLLSLHLPLRRRHAGERVIQGLDEEVDVLGALDGPREDEVAEPIRPQPKRVDSCESGTTVDGSPVLSGDAVESDSGCVGFPVHSSTR